jgi:hypothetical protein
VVGDVVEKPAEDLVVAHLVKWTNIGQLILKVRKGTQGPTAQSRLLSSMQYICSRSCS